MPDLEFMAANLRLEAAVFADEAFAAGHSCTNRGHVDCEVCATLQDIVGPLPLDRDGYWLTLRYDRDGEALDG